MYTISPNPKQAEFFNSTANMCLYGGAAGGGKSFALIVDALGLNYPSPLIQHHKYNGLILRKTSKELAGIIAETRDLYPKVYPGANLVASRNRWEFPSGAKITFGVAEKEVDVHKFQGLEYSYIGIDEAGLYPSDYVVTFLVGRLRNSHGIPNRFRMTSNPTRNTWLRDLFRIQGDGKPTHFWRTFKLPSGQTVDQRYQYIQAKLEDNSHINYEEYAGQIMQMDEATQQAWLNGRWDSFDCIDGYIYQREMDKLDAEHRITTVPYDRAAELDIYFDIGRDGTPQLWVQRIGNEINIIDMHHSTDVDITYHIEWIKNRVRETGRRINRIILPHDGTQKHVNSPYSTEEVMKQYMPDIEILSTPRSNNLPIEAGISNVKAKFKFIRIDRSCEFLIESLRNYQRKYNKTTKSYGEILHDRYSHCADALRYVCQDDHYEQKKRINNFDLSSFYKNSRSYGGPAI